MNPVEYRFCPRCAGRLESRTLKQDDPERLVCDACGFVFYLGPKLVAGAIVETDGGIVLIQRAIEPGYGLWTFPGGFVERGEVAEAAPVTGGDPAPLDETLDVRAFPPDELPWSEMAFPSTGHALKDYLRRF